MSGYATFAMVHAFLCTMQALLYVKMAEAGKRKTIC